MKFLHLSTVVKNLVVCLTIGLSAYPFLTYGFSFWGSPTTNTTFNPQEHNKTASQLSQNPPTTSEYDGTQFWQELRRSFHIEHYTYNYQVREQIEWFQNHPKWLRKTLTNAAPYMYYVYSQVVRRNLPGELVLLPVIESAYDPFAYSDRGAAGLWQLMPGTASGYGIKEDWWYDGRRDIYASTHAALDYLTYLQSFFNGNWLYTFAAYNAGPGTLENAINYNAERDRGTKFWDLPLPAATTTYVPQLLALAAIIEDPHEYGINLPALKDGPYFAEVDIGRQINLTTAARMADISVHELYILNPGYNRWATDPNGPSLLLLPIDKIDEFKSHLAQLALEQRVIWHRYEVRVGDTLGSIAAQFGTHIAVLQQINKIHSSRLKPGQMLVIPKHTTAYSDYRHSNLERNHTTLPDQVVVSVSEGDSLWSLAVKYHVQPQEIQLWNHIPPNTPLHIGQNLIIKLPHSNSMSTANHNAAKTKVTTAVIANKKPHAEHSSPIHYRIKGGDSLSSIAHVHHVSIEQLRKWNRKALRKYLRVGEEIVIY